MLEKLQEAYRKDPRKFVKCAIRIVATGLVVLMALVFVFNLFRPNVRASVGDAEIDKNIEQVSSFQTAEVKTIEAAVKRIEKDASSGNKDGIRIVCRRRFADSVILGDSLTYKFFCRNHS